MSARILVVDDIMPNVKLLEVKLTNEYYDVITASNGREALKKIENDSPDIVLLDVMMPEMDGFEVCRRVKENPETAHIPIIMVTALTDTADRVRGLEAGADDFLCKPVNDTALFARVRSLIRLKMTVDEWRARENTANALGVMNEETSVMTQDVSGAHILVVEDQSFEATKIEESLLADQHNVYTVDGGLQAMERAAVSTLDLIVISLDLEGEDGLRLCSHLKSNEHTRSVPILMVGNDGALEKVARGLEIGAHDYIMRPLDRNELLARIRTQIRRKRFQEKLRANYEVSLSMALTDSLTGLFNRRYLTVHLEKLLDQPAGQRKPMAVLMFDIDHFKSVNDTHGHAVGDEVLKIFSQRLKTRMRSFDLLARMGGEEFVAVLVDITKERACYIAERLRNAIARDPMPVSSDAGELKISTSIGAAYLEPGDETSVDDALKRSDELLYEAKEGGRNAVVFETVGKLDPADYNEPDRAKIDD